MDDSTAPTAILLPSFNASMEEGSIVNWLVAVGDTVQPGQVLAEIETEKAVVELEAKDSGVIVAIDVPAGGPPVTVGTMIARLQRTAAGDVPDARIERPAAGGDVAPSHAADSIRLEPHRSRQPVQGLGQSPPLRRDERSRTASSRPQRTLASPRARRMARERGLSLADIQGSGLGGGIVSADLASPASSTKRMQPSPPTGQSSRAAQPTESPALTALGIAPGSYELTPLTGMRKTIARRLTDSFRDAPHFSLAVDVVLDSMMQHRKSHNRLLAEGGTRLSFNDYLVWAAAAALEAVPDANVSYTDDGIARHHHANIGVAVAIEGGLVTPVVRSAETKDLLEVAGELRDLVERAHTRRLEKTEMDGGTLTVSNLGTAGIKSFTSILNPPQACILSVGAAEQRPIFRDSGFFIATLMTVTLTCDHRVVDGVTGAEFLSAFKARLEAKPTTRLA